MGGWITTTKNGCEIYMKIQSYIYIYIYAYILIGIYLYKSIYLIEVIYTGVAASPRSHRLQDVGYPP